MKKKSGCNPPMGDQESEDMEGEENRNNTHTTGLLYSEADRCPICLNYLLGKEVGFPESCNHVFCITCILKWAETLASCPIDRKPFQAVLKFSALEGCVKVGVKRQLREIKDKQNESPLKKQHPSRGVSKSYMRKRNIIREDLLCERFYDLMLYRNFSNSKMRGKKNGAVKPRRSNQCTSPCIRNFFSNMFSSSSHSGESFTYRAYCTEFIEVSEISAMVRQKRQELELSWFPGLGRIGFIPWNVETEVLPLITSVLPRTIFPSTMSLENFGMPHKECALARTHGGEEKKQTSGTSNTRGSRRKPATTTPTRRSTRTTRAETLSQSQKAPVSNNSGSDAPGNSAPSVSVSPPSELEKQTRQAPKRKSIRRGGKAPLLKKRLRRPVPTPEKTSSSESTVEEEAADSDAPPVLEKEQQSDVESTDICSVQTDVENHLVNSLNSCSEQTRENEENSKNHDTEEQVEFSCSESCTQEPPVIVGEEENQTLEDTGAEAKIVCIESEVSQETFVKGSDPLDSSDHAPASSESEVKTLACADCPPGDLITRSASDVEGHQPVCLSQLGEVSEDAESVVNEEKTMQSLQVESTDNKESAAKIEVLIASPKLHSSEGEIVHTVDRSCIESAEIQSPKHIETENAEVTPTCDASENESLSNQECEHNLLKNNLDNTQLGTSLEEKTGSLIDHPIPIELPSTQSEQSEKHVSEDNNETIPMECDSFCSDQNESEVESSVNADAKQLNENDVAHSNENKSSSDPTDEKVETVSQSTESPVGMTDKGKKPRTRRSRFHSPSTTWSPNKDATEEKKRSQSPSPKRGTGVESKTSRSPSPKKESARGRRKSRSLSPRKDVLRERRHSQSRSPKRESSREAKRSESQSPRRDPSRENRRSQSRVKDSSSREKSRSRSRERENDRDGPRRDRDRERRARRWSRSRSRSRSPSRSRTKSKTSSFSRNERDHHSPRWKERWTNDGWRCPRGNDRYRRTDSEKQDENMRKGKSDSADTNAPNSSDKHRNDCPSWVTEKINSGPDPRTRNPEKLKDSHWEENRNENSGNSWSKNFGSGWMSNRGRGTRGRGTYGGSFAFADQSENRWQNRKPLSGNSNSPGNDSLKFMEQQPYKRKSEQEFTFDTPADRSGWTSASSWAVRKTLPADVQNYYSRRGRNASGPQSAWMRQEETPEQDSNLKDQTNQVDGSQLPVNMMQPQMNIIQQQMTAQPQPMNIYPYPVGVHAPLMNMQRSPFPMHPQLPLHLHPGMPLMQVAPPTVTQGLPPPPPPPPPSQQVSYIASQPDGKQLQGVPTASHVSSNMSTPVLPAPTAAPGNAGAVQGPSSGNTSSSSLIQASNAAVKLAESKKLQIQEKAAQEVKLAIKPFYQNKDITKEEYKEIVRKAVDKVCHSRSGEVNSTKVANLVKAYVDKYKYSRKGSQKKTLEEPVSTEKNTG
ncbi:protein SCAF11 isoform X2 [Nannospalax galili]|uniref:protein SCAF11 isoform X2 n=1 Tax=Nannospalax galili TaxID=1026970 RepID=UPI0004ED2086|nr:protein SCAF11 isoform X2 [Nannospalax galili]